MGWAGDSIVSGLRAADVAFVEAAKLASEGDDDYSRACLVTGTEALALAARRYLVTREAKDANTSFQASAPIVGDPRFSNAVSRTVAAFTECTQLVSTGGDQLVAALRAWSASPDGALGVEMHAKTLTRLLKHGAVQLDTERRMQRMAQQR